MAALENLLRRDRLIVSAGLVLICLMSWWYLIAGGGTGMNAATMSSWQFPPPLHSTGNGMPWNLHYCIVMVLMWWIMMIAMMMPSAGPTILLYASVYRHAQKKGQVASQTVPVPAFVGGYLLMWLLFSLLATLVQWSLGLAGLMHTMMMWSTNTLLSAVLLIAAGIYEFSPQKSVCLRYCQSPADFISKHWRSGHSGALRMGLEHGSYCVGCCWLLMALLFVGGVMNLVWIAGLALLVLIEKLAPLGLSIGRVLGAVLIVAGVSLLITRA